MKYELVTTDVGVETPIDASNYKATVTIALHPTDGVAPDFSKDITVVSTNQMTGYEVDAQRAKAVEDYLQEINS